MPCVPGGSPARSRGFTLIEVLIVVVVLGIAGALVIPSMSQTGVLRVQAAVRTIVSDITFAQSDAVAFQERRAVVFDVEGNGYRLVEVPAGVIDEDNTMYDPTKKDGLFVVTFNEGDDFGGSRITGASFDGDRILIFDALGGPVATADAATPGVGGRVVIEGAEQRYDIVVEGFTGRVTVERIEGEDEDEDEDEDGGGG